MKTTVRVLRGRHRGRSGWISGDLATRSARGVTKALVKLSDDVELLETANLEAVAQLGLFADPQTETPPAVSQRRSDIVGNVRIEARYSFGPSAVQILQHRHHRADHHTGQRHQAGDLRSKPNDPFGLDQ